jgi:DNA-binding NarL/FixJ family response regulator
MNTPLCATGGRRLRVLLVGNAGAASLALSAWLREQEMLDVAGPAKTTDAAVALAVRLESDVVLLDFHGLAVSIGDAVSFFKELSPPPLVLVLTHDASATMRRRCREAQVDAVFDKTTELETVAALLERTRKSIASLSAYEARANRRLTPKKI